MRQLDQRDFVLRFDVKGMYSLTLQFPTQCRTAFEMAEATPLDLGGFQPQNIVLSGLGGSAAGGDVLRSLFDADSKIPFAVNRDYDLPSSVGKESLVLAASYSGNTEETLSAYRQAVERGARVIGITSGGALGELCGANGHPCFRIPGGQPPRTALGYMLFPAIAACVRLGYLPRPDFDTCFALLDRCAYDWAIEAPFEDNEPKQLAARFHEAVPILYGLGPMPGMAAYRWKGQINENAKTMCFCHTFPELNHNEILGWLGSDAQGVDRWALAILEDGQESEKMKARARVTEELIGSRATTSRFRARGESLLERCLSLIYAGDFVSLYLAALRGVDPENIDWLDHLKGELAKVP